MQRKLFKLQLKRLKVGREFLQRTVLSICLKLQMSSEKDDLRLTHG